MVNHMLRKVVVGLLYSRSSVSYASDLLNCFCAGGDGRRLQKLRFHTYFQNCILHCYAKSGKLSDAQNLFDRMLNRDIFSYNAMLSAYSKMGCYESLWDFFNSMPLRDSVSYNTMISGLCSARCEEKALVMFVRMLKERIEPTGHTYVSSLNACSKLMEMRIGKVIHGKIVVGGFEENVFVCNALIDFYAKCGKMERTQWLFQMHDRKNLVSWNLMISGYLKNGQPDKCIELFQKMKFSNFMPDQITFSNVLVALFQIGCIDEAIQIFRKIEGKDKVCWTTLLVGYAQNGLEEDALVLFNEMLSEGVTTDEITMSSVISSCSKLASFYQGRAVHAKAVHIGVDWDLLVSSALIDMYSKCGEPTDAGIIFKEMKSKNVVSWNSMILGYAQNGRDLEALDLYDEMLQKNLKPSDITFVGVLRACFHAGFLERGQEYFDSISEVHGMKQTLDHYTCMITLIGRWGDVSKALDLIECMPYEPNCRIWSAVLSVCKIKGDIAHGEIAAKQLSELDPNNAEPFIVLSNMYAACKRWKDVAKMRSLMKSNQVKKITASSWTEVGGKLHKFMADDKTHPESEVIYLELNDLIRKLEGVGYSPDKTLALKNVGEDEKFLSVCYHSEKLALAFVLVRMPQQVAPIRIIKNIRICSDCHLFMKFASKVVGRKIILRDSNRFHHFVEGQCSCNDCY